jgi:micrococcal nuclease
MITKRKIKLLFIVISILIIIVYFSIYAIDNTNPPTEHKKYNNIEFEGTVTYVVDGDTLDIDDNRIRLSLVNTPERGQEGYMEAKRLVQNLCLNKEGQVDIDDGQRSGDRYGREVGIVYCDGINVNKALIENDLAIIYSRYCHISEFSNEEWAKSDCH